MNETDDYYDHPKALLFEWVCLAHYPKDLKMSVANMQRTKVWQSCGAFSERGISSENAAFFLRAHDSPKNKNASKAAHAHVCVAARLGK
jgi:hypothetical protein